jgi:hypothetical protein
MTELTRLVGGEQPAGKLVQMRPEEHYLLLQRALNGHTPSL